MGIPKPVKCNGEEYASLKDLADAFGFPKEKVTRRISEWGWTPEQAVELESRPKRKGHNARRIITAKGIFESVREASAFFGIEEGTLASRLRKGWSDDEACELVTRRIVKKQHPAAKTIECQGEKYSSIGELADAYGLAYRLVYKRLRLNWTPEQAVGLKPKPPRYRNADGTIRHHQWNNPQITSTGKKFAGSGQGHYLLYQITNSVNAKTYIGVTTGDLRTRLRGHRASARKGQSGALYNAMRKYGIDKFDIQLLRDDASNIEELLHQEVEAIEKYGTLKSGYNSAPGGSLGTAKPITVDGKQFESRGLAAEFYGVPVGAFNLRIERLGWSPEEAAGLVKRDKWQNHEIEFSHDGIDYQFNSLKQAAEFFDIDWKLAHDRNSKTNWTIKEVLELVPLPLDKTKYGGLKVVFEDVTYDSIAQFAEAHQLKKSTVLHYVSTCGLSAEETYFVVSNNLQKELRKVKMKHECTYPEAVKILKDEQA